MSASLLLEMALVLLGAPPDPSDEGSPLSAFSSSVPFSSSVRLGATSGLTDDLDGTRVVVVPRFELRFALDARFRIDASWALAVLAQPGGVIVDPSGNEGRDDVPRSGNPLAGVWWRAYGDLATSVDLGFAACVPMASIETPNPPGGRPFSRAAHTEAVYRRALATTGFAEPWLFVWDTASLLTRARLTRIEGPLGFEVEGAFGLLIPAGRLRSGVGAAVSVGASAVADLGPFDLGLRGNGAYVSPQRSTIDGALQLRGFQLAIAPSARLELEPEGPFLEGTFVVSVLVDIEPVFPERAVWGIDLAVGFPL